MGFISSGSQFTVSNISYDPQGNIETLIRNAPTMANPEGTPVDQLSYNYTARTNRLASVADAVETDLDWDARPTSFVYNRVGSVTWTTEELTPTTYRETEIQVYDERQLPEELRIRLIATPGGAYDSTMVSYRYDVNGQRIRKQIRETAQGPDVVYERYVRDGMRLIGVFDENDELKNWNLGGIAGLVGRADPATLGFTRRYYVSDHLGSIRAVVDQAGTVIEGRDYYPYGLTMPGRFYVQADTTREGYTGHELDKETGDYYAGARYYSPAFARWFVPDPMAEAYPGLSPYNYVMGNPLSLIDPDGMNPDIWELDRAGYVVNHIEDTSVDAFYIVNEGGNRIEGASIEFEYGTVTAERNPPGAATIGGEVAEYTMTLFEISGDTNASGFFEFVSDPANTSVEWTHAKIGEADSGRNIVGTAHDSRFTPVGGYLNRTGHTLREVAHNHTSGILYPSPGDIVGAGRYPDSTPLFIYTAGDGYFQYNATTPELNISP